MEIKNSRKWTLALIALVLTLITAIFVQAAPLTFRLMQAGTLSYLSAKMLVNYLVVFALMFVVVYLVAFKEDKRPKGVMLAFFITSLFAIAVALVVYIVGQQNVFIWEIGKLGNIKWLFRFKTIINILLALAICLAVKAYWLKGYGKDREGKIATWVIIFAISIFIASTVNYSAETPKGALPAGVTYYADAKYVDRWLWQYPQVSGMGKFFFGDSPNGSYVDNLGRTRQGVLKFGESGKGLPAFFFGWLLILWLFTHYKIFKYSKFFHQFTPILLAALIANEGYTKNAIVDYAWWVAFLVMNSYFRNSGWGREKPGMATGLAFAIVQTIYVAIVGSPPAWFPLGGSSFAWNFGAGIIFGFLWDMFFAKKGILEAGGEMSEAARAKISGMFKRAPGEFFAWLGTRIRKLSPTRFDRLARWLESLRSWESLLIAKQRSAATVLRNLIAAENAPTRDLRVITDLRRELARHIIEIRDLQRNIAAITGGTPP